MKPVLLLSNLAMLCFVFNGTTLAGFRSAPNAGPAGRMQGVIDVRIELHNGPLDAPDCRLRDY